jgi:FkbM family methyltransferase
MAFFSALIKQNPRNYLKLLSFSPYTIKNLSRFDISLVVDTRDPAISKPILCLGRYEEDLTQHLTHIIKQDTHFVDIGANIGFFSILAAKIASNGKVWSFEPDPINYRLLKTNIALNNLENIITPYNAAISDNEEQLYFSSLGYEKNIGARFTAKQNETLIERSLPGAKAPSKITAHSLDSILKNEKIDIIKVDVEGFEPFVFSGMREILNREKPIIFTEFAPGTIQHISKTDPAQLLNFIIKLGYNIFIITENGTLQDTANNIEAILSFCNKERKHHLDLLLKHKSRNSD